MNIKNDCFTKKIAVERSKKKTFSNSITVPGRGPPTTMNESQFLGILMRLSVPEREFLFRGGARARLPKMVEQVERP